MNSAVIFILAPPSQPQQIKPRGGKGLVFYIRKDEVRVSPTVLATIIQDAEVGFRRHRMV